VNVTAVVVCYHPDLDHLRRTCRRLIAEGASVVVVDNSEESPLRDLDALPDCTMIVNGENLGMARAQNIGIARAVANGAQVVIFLDQDSTIPPDFMRNLLASMTLGAPLVLAPVYRDHAKGFEYPSLRLTPFGLLRKVFAGDRAIPYDVDVVISSGSAATVETFERAGVMDEDFFIDFVDTEWSLRCRQHGVPVRVVPTVTMQHSVGSRSIRLGLVTLLVHNPTRCYYQIRNCLQLFHKESVPLALAVRETAVLGLHKILLLIFVSRRGTYLRAYVDAVRDALRGITGRRPWEA
jgi:rhamnosyltransferase